MGSDKKFRVVIVGGGPAGLTAAHSLAKAGIDFVLLERRPAVVEDVGASFVLEPRTLRVLAQLGLLCPVTAVATDFDGNCVMTKDGVQYSENRLLAMNKEYFGCKAVAIHRADYLRVLYDELGELKSKVFTDKRVSEILSTEEGVSVLCADGTQYDGSIVMGADGVHSQVRHLMRALALKKNPEAKVNPEKPFVAEYRLMWCSFPRQPGFRAGLDWQTHGPHFSVQHLVSDDRAWFFVYERLAKPTRSRVSYTQEDVAAYVERHGGLHIGPQLRIKDAYAQQQRCGMANLEEGIVDYWSWERLALVGDAAHKVTPNIGQGYNNGVQDVVVLVNELYELLNASPGKGAGAVHQPSVTELSAAFRRYQASRKERITADFELSARITRLSAWANPIYWFIDRWIMPHLPSWARTKMFEKTQAEKHGTAHILAFVKGEEPFSGNYPFTHKISKE